jgi:hypothetical protein
MINEYLVLMLLDHKRSVGIVVASEEVIGIEKVFVVEAFVAVQVNVCVLPVALSKR